MEYLVTNNTPQGRRVASPKEGLKKRLSHSQETENAEEDKTDSAEQDSDKNEN